MRNNSRKNYRRCRRNTGVSQIKLVGIVAVIVIIAIIIVISCFNKTKKTVIRQKHRDSHRKCDRCDRAGK